MITALSNHFSRLLSPCLHLSAVVKTARCLSVRADCGFEPITLTAYISATLLSKFQIGNETVTIFNH